MQGRLEFRVARLQTRPTLFRPCEARTRGHQPNTEADPRGAPRRANSAPARDRAPRSMVPATLLPATTRASTLECMSATRTTIAGIPIPDSALARGATQFVQDVSTQLLFDHSRRVFLWASLQGEKLGLDYDPELLY